LIVIKAANFPEWRMTLAAFNLALVFSQPEWSLTNEFSKNLSKQRKHGRCLRRGDLHRVPLWHAVFVWLSVSISGHVEGDNE
jgi:hypothetical protein